MLSENEIDALVSKRIVDVVTRAIKKDPAAMEALFHVRVRCNELILADPTIQADQHEGPPYLGVIGLLCGIAGTHSNGSPKIAVVYDQQERSGIPSRVSYAMVTTG